MKLITKLFLDGNLKGLTHTEKTYAGFEKGKIYSDCVTGSKYKIIELVQIDE